jgi:hypothetical protein
MADQIAGHGPGDLARGVREEPVEKRDACVVGQYQALCPRGSRCPRRTTDVRGSACPGSDGKVASL